ncbi:uncharacterized protein H6S33_001102 [Morchella sextelata]|uniref:uncharacterized protein n=1 Tax=Morchella sextelata TaxID=1174677 RepID=UPI001D0528D0|nr:uncharacterized protein H6S33_001102 [Morchella sextelata]KAH0608874.1 hypothetical protein H6S33_001102 [Morchella sextelata]
MRIPSTSSLSITTNTLTSLTGRLLPKPVLRASHLSHISRASVGSLVQRNHLQTLTAPISTATSSTSSSTVTPSNKQHVPALIPRSRSAQQNIFHPSFSLFAKRPPRPFPIPFNSPPASSFPDSLSPSLARVPRSEGASYLRGITNGDDAIVYARSYLGVADGVGAWNTRSAGHAALWSRLMLHFFALEVEGAPGVVDPVHCLTKAYHSTLHATTESTSSVWQGTTTACVGTLTGNTFTIANIGDSRCWIYRPSAGDFVLKTTEQWHWFDCPKQLGTNSPDTPATDADVQSIELEDGDMVIMASDGLPDNLWDHEILTICEENAGSTGPEIAEQLVRAAKKVAIDPFGESPYMERAVDEGLPVEGGKWDDISVLTAVYGKGRF